MHPFAVKITFPVLLAIVKIAKIFQNWIILALKSSTAVRNVFKKISTAQRKATQSKFCSLNGKHTFTGREEKKKVQLVHKFVTAIPGSSKIENEELPTTPLQ